MREGGFFHAELGPAVSDALVTPAGGPIVSRSGLDGTALQTSDRAEFACDGLRALAEYPCMKIVQSLRLSCLGALALLGAACSPNLSSLENHAQVMLGRSQSELIDAMGQQPEYSADGSELHWRLFDREVREHYHPAEYYEEKDEVKDHHGKASETRRLYREAYIDYETIDHALEVSAELSGHRVSGLHICSENWPFPPSRSWVSRHRAELEWNSAAADDDLSRLQELERKYPMFTSREHRTRACIQAARFNGDEVLSFYIGKGLVNLDDAVETWAPAGGRIDAENVSYVLVRRSMRDILRSQHSDKLRAKLAAKGINY